MAETFDEEFDEHRDARQPLAPGRIERRQRKRLDVMAVGEQRDQLPVAQRRADDHVGQTNDAGAFDRQPQCCFRVVGGHARPHLDHVDAAGAC